MSSIWVACHFLSLLPPRDVARLTACMKSASTKWLDTHVVIRDPCLKTRNCVCTSLPGEQCGGSRINFHVHEDSGAVRPGNYILYPARGLVRKLTDMDLDDDRECAIPKTLI